MFIFWSEKFEKRPLEFFFQTAYFYMNMDLIFIKIVYQFLSPQYLVYFF